METAAEYQAIEQEAQEHTAARNVINRFVIETDGDTVAATEHPEGEYVRYEDHLRAMLNPSEQKLCEDMPAFWALAQFILDNLAELEQDSAFAGFQIQRAIDQNGNLQMIRLIPCDRIGDIVCARVASVQENPEMIAQRSNFQLKTADGNTISLASK